MISKYINIILFIILISLVACKKKQASNTSDIIPQPAPKEEVKTKTIIPPVVINYDTTIWTNIRLLDTSILLDIRYATENNFVGEPIYDCGECFLRPEIADALVKVHNDLKEKGYGGIKIFDCYRPRPYQQRLWDKVPDPRFVSNPKKGSMHTRGAAVDLTIVDTYGKNLNMGTEFDSFEKKAYHNYPDLDSLVIQNRQTLKQSMFKRGFKHISTEWWHYSYTLKNYDLSDWVWDCSNE